MTTRDWRESAKPKWVVEEAEKEMAELKKAASLRWPIEPKPKPAPFQWGGYDKLTGTAVEGTYYMFHASVTAGVYNALYITEVTIRKKDDSVFPEWQFSTNGGDFNNNVKRGPLYLTRRDAAVAAVWDMCEQASAILQIGWDTVRKESTNADPV